MPVNDDSKTGLVPNGATDVAVTRPRSTVEETGASDGLVYLSTRTQPNMPSAKCGVNAQITR